MCCCCGHAAKKNLRRNTRCAEIGSKTSLPGKRQGMFVARDGPKHKTRLGGVSFVWQLTSMQLNYFANPFRSNTPNRSCQETLVRQGGYRIFSARPASRASRLKRKSPPKRRAFLYGRLYINRLKIFERRVPVKHPQTGIDWKHLLLLDDRRLNWLDHKQVESREAG